MLQKIETGRTGLRAPEDGVLRHPDGSINFDAYRALASEARRAAMTSSTPGAMQIVRAAFSAIGSVLAGRALPATRRDTR